MKSFLIGITEIFLRIQKHKVSVFAAQATLFLIISFLPFLMLFISLLKFFLPQTATDVMALGVEFLPKQVIPLLNTVVNEIYFSRTVSVVSLTAITALWAASKGVMALLTGLDNIYNLSRGYIKSRFLSVLYTLVILASLLITLFLLVIGSRIVAFTEGVFPAAYAVTQFVIKFPVVLYIVLLAGVFAGLYKLLPGQKMPFRNHIPGAFAASGGWILFSKLYSYYVNNFADYSILYGSLAAVVLLMLWLYFCMNIFLWGAEINEYIVELTRKETQIGK